MTQSKTIVQTPIRTEIQDMKTDAGDNETFSSDLDFNDFRFKSFRTHKLV